MVAFKGSSKTTELLWVCLPFPLHLPLASLSFLCEVSELLESVLLKCLLNFRLRVLLL